MHFHQVLLSTIASELFESMTYRSSGFSTYCTATVHRFHRVIIFDRFEAFQATNLHFARSIYLLCCLSSIGEFLWVNSSAFGGPWVLSPWLWDTQGPCGLDMAVFLHPKQSGQYTIWLIERDKPPLALFSTDTLPRITG